MPFAVLVLVLPAAPGAQGPVAVLPFKNLGSDASLSWLELGMAETLVADLKRSASLQVVERSEVERALAQVAKKSAETPVAVNGVTEDRALQVGKLVAAKTVVLGSFQRAGGQVRIAARFVAVETGVVTDAARATGPLESVFAVQDELVTALLGAPPAQKPRRGRPAKAIRAFERWGQSLSAKDDAQKKELLVASVKEDPEFGPAVDDLAALEKRLAGYAETSAVALAAAEKKLLARVENGKLSSGERSEAAARLLEGLANARRFNTLASVAPRVGQARLPGADELAAHGLIAAQLGLHRHDQALQAGEAYLKQFPAGPRFKEIETRMREVIAARKRREGRKAEYEADLKEKLADCKGALECDYAPCLCSRWTSQQGPRMLETCSKFLAVHRADKGDDAAEKIAAARFFVALSHVELGQWKEAAAAIAELEKGPVREWDDDVEKLRLEWPADEASR